MLPPDEDRPVGHRVVEALQYAIRLSLRNDYCNSLVHRAVCLGQWVTAAQDAAWVLERHEHVERAKQLVHFVSMFVQARLEYELQHHLTVERVEGSKCAQAHAKQRRRASATSGGARRCRHD